MAAVLLPLNAADGVAAFTGTWRGSSTCVANNTACRDETVVYRISTIPGKSGSAAVSADKIVDANAVNMGTLEFHYQADRNMLICEYAQGVWRLKVDGAKMEGTLTRPDGTLFRRVKLSKES